MHATLLQDLAYWWLWLVARQYQLVTHVRTSGTPPSTLGPGLDRAAHEIVAGLANKG